MYTSENTSPPHISHPGKMLHEELQARGRSQKKLAAMIEKTPVEISYLITGKRDFSLEMSVLIGTALGTGYEPWIGMQHTYDLINIKKKHKKTLRTLHALT